jgi:hypothetical protein
MIVVTREGKLPTKTNRQCRGHCNNCGCVVEFNEQDGTPSNGCIMIDCPTTGCRHKIAGSTVPFDI